MSIGFHPSGAGPGGILPASTGEGQLLIGDGAGAWAGNANLPIVAPANEGQIMFWDGAGRYRYSAVPVSTGQILQWDETSNTWVLTAAPANGNVLVFNSGTGLWTPQAPGDIIAPTIAFGNWTINAGTQFMTPYHTDGATGATLLVAGVIPITRTGTLRRLVVSHGNPSGATNLTYTVFLNGVATAITVTLSSGATVGSDLVNTVAVVTGDRIGLQSSNPGAGLGVRTQAELQVAA